MVPEDEEYVTRLLMAGLLKSPVLELGTGYGAITCREAIEAAGLRYVGTDLEEGPGVDVAADFENPDHMSRFDEPFGTVLVMNVLEHTFDPIRILDNALTLVRPGGCLVVIAPTVWPLHDYPIDTWRISPGFLEEYARRRQLELPDEWFQYTGRGRVRSYNSGGVHALPPPWRTESGRLRGKIAHRVLRTFGRQMVAPSHVSTAAVMRRPH